MNADNIEGKAQEGVGRAQEAVGKALDDTQTQVRGEVRQFSGKVQDAVGVAKTKVAKSAEKARTLAASATSQASDTYGDLRQKAQQVAGQVDPLVKERPYAALGVAALAGLIVGALFFSRGARVIYVKPSRD